MSWTHPPSVKPGPLTRADAEAINRYLADMARFVGGFSVAPPMRLSQSRAGIQLGVDIPAAASDDDFYVRLTGNPGVSCGYLEGVLQVKTLVGGCYKYVDGPTVQILDLNATSGSTSGS